MSLNLFMFKALNLRRSPSTVYLSTSSRRVVSSSSLSSLVLLFSTPYSSHCECDSCTISGRHHRLQYTWHGICSQHGKATIQRTGSELLVMDDARKALPSQQGWPLLLCVPRHRYIAERTQYASGWGFPHHPHVHTRCAKGFAA